MRWEGKGDWGCRGWGQHAGGNEGWTIRERGWGKRGEGRAMLGGACHEQGWASTHALALVPGMGWHSPTRAAWGGFPRLQTRRAGIPRIAPGAWARPSTAWEREKDGVRNEGAAFCVGRKEGEEGTQGN